MDFAFSDMEDAMEQEKDLTALPMTVLEQQLRRHTSALRPARTGTFAICYSSCTGNFTVRSLIRPSCSTP